MHLTGYRLHIDGNFVMIDVDTALINPTQLPFTFVQRLKELTTKPIEVCPDDPVWTINCPAVRPGRILIAYQVSDRTLDQLNDANISMRLVPYDKVYLGGGIHCSTMELVRDPA